MDARLRRIRTSGTLGDRHGVGGGVSELRIDVGPGYRIYYGWKIKDEHLLTILAGKKKGQQKDIDKAKEYWKFYLNSKKEKK